MDLGEQVGLVHLGGTVQIDLALGSNDPVTMLLDPSRHRCVGVAHVVVAAAMHGDGARARRQVKDRHAIGWGMARRDRHAHGDVASRLRVGGLVVQRERHTDRVYAHFIQRPEDGAEACGYCVEDLRIRGLCAVGCDRDGREVPDRYVIGHRELLEVYAALQPLRHVIDCFAPVVQRFQM